MPTRYFLSFLLMSLLCEPSFGQQASSSTIIFGKHSKIWIEGTSSVASYTCKADQLEAEGIYVDSNLPLVQKGQSQSVSLNVQIPVEVLDCGSKPMNKDMYKALNSKEFPKISYFLTSASLEDRSNAGSVSITTQGKLRINGVEHAVELKAQANPKPDGTFHVWGSVPVSMHDFKIKPPRPLFGLIKVRPELRIYFDVNVQLQNDSLSLSPPPSP